MLGPEGLHMRLIDHLRVLATSLLILLGGLGGPSSPDWDYHRTMREHGPARAAE
jgi:hypothetical protein